MCFDELKERALTLPMSPGVYVMRDKTDRVIYVGKAKKLKNRVTQYFQDMESHTPKTRMMVSKIDHFDVIVAASEFEALVLECSLIKRYQPKYNILLKDGKGYPYVRLNMKERYPALALVGKISDDGAEYYGPYGSRGVTQELLSMIRTTLKLPSCTKRFPDDIGKGRVCLHYHMDQCEGWCRGERNESEYRRAMEQARQLLRGDYRLVAEHIRAQMNDAAENLNFELAAGLRDRLKAVEALGKKQLVTAGAHQDTDVIGYARNEARACFAVLHFSNGNLVDKDYEIISAADDPEAAVSALMKQYYLNMGFIPRKVLLPFEIEDSALFEQMMEQQFFRKTSVHVPLRGDNARLVELANANALEEVSRVTSHEERVAASLQLLGKMLSIAPPSRIESYDISNISGTDIVAGMVVFSDGRPRRRDYRQYKIEGLSGQDDYASMEQVLTRRFTRYIHEEKGFDEKPDLLLIDGGVAHAQTALRVLQRFDLSIPVFGMVKDDRHRTRALVAPNGQEIGIDTQQAVYALIGTIQEETHNYAIGFHRKLRSKRLRYSALDEIPGIGPKRKEDLLKHFKSLAAIKEARLEDLLRYLPQNAARSVYQHFHTEEGE